MYMDIHPLAVRLQKGAYFMRFLRLMKGRPLIRKTFFICGSTALLVALSRLRKTLVVCGFVALLLALMGVFALSPASTAQAATLQPAAQAQRASDIVITSVQRVSRSAIEITFITRGNYDSFQARYINNGQGWRIIKLGRYGRARVIRVIVYFVRAPHHFCTFEVGGIHGSSAGGWSAPYNWVDD
jgi:hypothetical protein